LTTYDIRGELQLDGALAHGWCWSPQRVRERLQVELLLDGKVIGTCVASRLRLDLVQDGLRDGYHGFSIPLLHATGAYGVLEAREAGSGQIFGRRLGKAVDPFDWLARTEALQQQFVALHHGVSDESHGVAVSALGAGLAELGRVLSRVRRAFCLPPGFRLPVILSPRFSLLIDAVPDSEAALAVVVALAPLVRFAAVELVVVDDGTGLASAALATLDGLSYFILKGGDLAPRLNRAAYCARGACIVLFDPCTATVVDLTSFLEKCIGSHCVFLCHAMLGAAQQVGLRDLQTAGLMHATACFVAMAVPNRIFYAMHGLESRLHDDVGAAALDFAQRAVRGGQQVQTLGR